MDKTLSYFRFACFKKKIVTKNISGLRLMLKSIQEIPVLKLIVLSIRMQ